MTEAALRAIETRLGQAARIGRVMLVTNFLQPAPRGGRELLCKLNHDALKEICGDGLSVFHIAKQPVRGWRAIVHAFRGHIDGMSNTVAGEVIARIRGEGVRKLFVDGSNLGEVVRRVKAGCPGVRVYTFFHNVEARFFLGALREHTTPKTLAVLLANYLAERKSVLFSDRLIALSERDSRLLGRVYGRRATDVSAIAVRDRVPSGAGRPAPQRERFALFVGGAFYANRAGIAWYARHVAPRVRIKTCVVGRGLEGLDKEVVLGRNIELVGEVEDVAPWYQRAHFVVAPIFDGSGMKTKVAEALMFGKRIIGTPEAFSGYEAVAQRAGRICASAEEFVRAIEAADDLVKAPFDAELRAAFEASYSYAAARDRLQQILSDLGVAGGP